MRQNVEPALVLSVAALIALTMTAAVLFFALNQPWLGLSLTLDEAQRVTVVHSQGPAKPVRPGSVLTALSAGTTTVELEAIDLVVEPDGAMGTYPNYRRFLERQDTLAQLLRQPHVQLLFPSSDPYTVTSAPRRPLSTLPVAFWVQWLVGVVAWLISASVFAYRQSEQSARYLLLSGAATLTFSCLAGVYSTRELALPGLLFNWLSDLNFLGGSIFIACFVAVLLHYPRQIGPRWLAPLVLGLYLGWFALQQLGFFTSMTFARRFLVMVGTFATFGLAAWHWHHSRRDPATRAALQWFLLSWIVGTGLFAVFILLPQLFGVDTSSLQGYAFLLFLLVYGGLASGILRYRLFELDRWWAGALLWLLMALFLIGLDFLFLFFLHLSSDLSLALALLLCGVLWLPVRSLIWRTLFNRRRQGSQLAHFRDITDIVLAPTPSRRRALWHALLIRLFEPLHIETRSDITTPSLKEEGLTLVLPGLDDLPSLALSYADGGRRLFSSRDLTMVQELLLMLHASIESRLAYEKGVQSERGRIARDIHDNIGAQLLSALHSPTLQNKDALIRGTLQDLRSIIDDNDGQAASWQEALANLRQETAERLQHARLGLAWLDTIDPSTPLHTPVLHHVRSIIREAVSNTVRHAQASRMRIQLQSKPDSLTIEIEDDGQGLPDRLPPQAKGLGNMRSRVEAAGGLMETFDTNSGLRIKFHLPLH